MPPPVDYPPRRMRFAYHVAKEQTPRAVRHAVRTRLLRPLSYAYAGTGVECPVCWTPSRSFFRGLCSRCGSGARHRLIALFLEREVALGQRPMRILHFAPEPGLVNKLRASPLTDYEPADLRPAPGFARVDVTEIDLPPRFDGIIISHVLEHVPDDAAAMREMYRVLCPGGWAIVLVPVGGEHTFEDSAIAGRWERHRLYGQQDHVRIYGRDISLRLRAAGFSVTERMYAQELDPQDVPRYGLNWREMVHFCTK